MKSVGEIMSIGRSFEEMIQKGLRMIGQGMHGFVGNDHVGFENLDEELSNPTDLRIFAIAQALEEGYSVERIEELTKIDKWFISRLKNIVDLKNKLLDFNRLEDLSDDFLRELKAAGFSDFQIARAVGLEAEMSMEEAGLTIRQWRIELGITPVVRRIDTLAAEYPARTNYLYLSY